VVFQAIASSELLELPACGQFVCMCFGAPCQQLRSSLYVNSRLLLQLAPPG
jgi:hypothetical protein